MSVTNQNKADIRVVIDTNIFVPALACREPASGFYTSAIRTCWKVVFSEQISEEYQRVIHEYGYRADVVLMEMAKLDHMNKYRSSNLDPDLVDDDLAPRKDRHIVAPCLEKKANLIVTLDDGILEKKERIKEVTGAEVLGLQEAQARLDPP
jgi:putative PIN family toxin of toxin-antitoxin system